ncbi:MAG: hypothetical protein WKF88_12230 [Ferruginibacter sp.]
MIVELPYRHYCRMLIILILFTLCLFLQATAQQGRSDSARFITLKASGNYHKSSFYKLFFGEHYRKEWNTQITVPRVLLDTIYGGLKPYQIGGSRQTQSIRVRDRDQREYVFRSVDKTLSGALPEIALGTFIENLANDQVPFSHPYAALAVAPLAEAAKIYHANPILVYVPKQEALGKFNDSTGGKIYTLEQRPDEDWKTAANFGNAENIVSTEKMLEKILKDNDNAVDQKAFAKARLFDMLIGDWGRHEDQWRWATFKNDKKTLYVPIPRDRDNAFTKFDGFLLRMIIKMAKARHLQTFDYDLKNIKRFNFPARHLDHHLLNELNEADWITISKDLQAALTDNIIDNAVKQFPPEVYPISGPEIAAKLKVRRDRLPDWAKKFYKFLSTEVEITGTEDNERFEVNRLSDTETELKIFKITKEGEIKKKPLYRRIFKTGETEEVRIYGIAGNDQYALTGKMKKGIKIRLIGGPVKDSYTDRSSVKGPSDKTKIYDNPGNEIVAGKETEVTISSDSAINKYDYYYFNYNNRGLKPTVSFNNDDRLHVGIVYAISKHKWRKKPLANTQYFDVKYSLSQKGISTTYANNFVELIGKWNLRNYVNYDAVRWTNFFGLGNETTRKTNDRDFNRTRSEEFIAKVNTDRVLKNKQKFTLGAGLQTYRIIKDTGRFLFKESQLGTPAMQRHETFGLAEAAYVYQHINDSVLPTKGISFRIIGNFTENLKRLHNSVGKFGAETNLYIPFSKKFGLKIRGGGSSLSGNPEFYQFNRLGGTETLRGYRRDRFYGKSTVFSQNELRFITNVRSRVFNGKFGIFGLYDAGRVWVDHQSSNTWHTGYGGGIIISPFNRLSISAAYALSSEDRSINIRLLRPL